MKSRPEDDPVSMLGPGPVSVCGTGEDPNVARVRQQRQAEQEAKDRQVSRRSRATGVLRTTDTWG